MGTSSAPARRTTARRRGSEAVAGELLEAALVEFAAHGFEGASTRAIAARAGWHQPQINYYFSSKEELWRAAVDQLFQRLDAEVIAGLDGAADSPAAVLAAAVRRFVRFSARHPELHRIMNLEATADSERLDWLVDGHVRERYAVVSRLWSAVRATGSGADLSALEVWELLIGVGALPFANAPLLARLADVDLTDDAVIDAHAARLATFLLPDGLTVASEHRDG